MTRRPTLIRVLIGMPFLLAYLSVLFPVIFLVSLVLGVVDAGWRLITGNGTRLTDWIVRLWDWNGSNARWVFTGRGSFELLP